MKYPKFSACQMYYLTTMHRQGSVPVDVVRTWDQRPLKGLFDRGYIHISAALDIRLTTGGEAAYQSSREPRLRNNPLAPLFGGRTVRGMHVVARRHKTKAA